MIHDATPHTLFAMSSCMRGERADLPSLQVCPSNLYVCCLADQGQAQQDLLLSELKRVGTQQEQLKKAVSEAAVEAATRGETLEISPLKSFKLSDSELAQLKSFQLKDRLGSVVKPPTADVSAVDIAEAVAPAPQEPMTHAPTGRHTLLSLAYSTASPTGDLCMPRCPLQNPCWMKPRCSSCCQAVVHLAGAAPEAHERKLHTV